jgi:post-segregation antitoxin (ccd killing protein)
MKRQVCLYLDVEIIEKLKEERINISELLNSMLKSSSIEEALLNRIKAQDDEIYKLKSKKSNKVVSIEV